MKSAIQSFIQRGFEGSSLRDIALAANTSVGLIRYHFGQKSDLYRDTLAFVSEQYNAVCLAALHAVQDDGSPEEIIFAWLSAPLSRWQDDTVASGEDVLRFLNKMGYESPTLTREVYESHYSYAINEWLETLRAHYTDLSDAAWYWSILELRGMYFNIVAHQDFTLWSLPSLNNKEEALKQAARDAVRLLEAARVA